MSLSPNEIRSLRLRLGWSAAELGRRLGCSVELVLKLETGQSQIEAHHENQLRTLLLFVEQTSARVAQIPHAESIMQRDQLAQVTHEVVAHLSQ